MSSLNNSSIIIIALLSGEPHLKPIALYDCNFWDLSLGHDVPDLRLWTILESSCFISLDVLLLLNFSLLVLFNLALYLKPTQHGIYLYYVKIKLVKTEKGGAIF